MDTNTNDKSERGANNSWGISRSNKTPDASCMPSLECASKGLSSNEIDSSKWPTRFLMVSLGSSNFIHSIPSSV